MENTVRYVATVAILSNRWSRELYCLSKCVWFSQTAKCPQCIVIFLYLARIILPAFPVELLAVNYLVC
jgi:hypothetical protein